MTITVKNHIHSIPYFNGVTSEELTYISENSTLYVYKASEMIFLENDLTQGLWIVEKGRVKIFKINQGGNEHILHLRGPGDTFNDIGALDGGNNPANATALSSEVQVWLVPSAVIAHILTHNPQVALNIIRLMARRVRRLVGQIEDLALYSVSVRLARFLLKQLDDPNLSGQGVTRTAIAAHLNTTPQTISVVLREIELLGAIQFNRHEIRVIDENKLQTIAML